MNTTSSATLQRLNWKPLGLAAGVFLAITFILCVLWDLLIPGQAMYESWMQLLPGFTWLSWGSFLLGLAETFVYGIFFGLVFAPLYNYFASKFAISQA